MTSSNVTVENKTPLHVARNKEVAEILIQNGADINSRDSNNQTPLHVTENKEVAEILIKNGADVNSRDRNGDTPLHNAIVNHETDKTKILVSLGADTSAQNNENQTPLHVARNNEVAEILIQNGANVNSRDRNNQTPLHVARNKEVAEILIQNGADVNSRDSNVSMYCVNTMDSFDNDFMSISALEEKVQEQNEETLKYKNLPTWLWYKINEVNEVDDDFTNKVTSVVKAIINTIVPLQNRFNTEDVDDMVNMAIEVEIGDWFFSDDDKVLYYINEDSDDDSEFERLDSDSEFDSGFYSKCDDEEDED
ncbi:unnamed protein product [Mytilus coruscus]|uniref:Uncharacterized protein n=1 Tax=Mytilus coruscus TaxID=42192 RepID=A0A6J8ARF3_MYTCO|nr:unnamed protein product [Mytilus coruscus]